MTSHCAHASAWRNTRSRATHAHSTRSQHTLTTHAHNTRSHHTLTTHAHNTRIQHTLTIHAHAQCTTLTTTTTHAHSQHTTNTQHTLTHSPRSRLSHTRPQRPPHPRFHVPPLNGGSYSLFDQSYRLLTPLERRRPRARLSRPFWARGVFCFLKPLNPKP